MWKPIDSNIYSLDFRAAETMMNGVGHPPDGLPCDFAVH